MSLILYLVNCDMIYRIGCTRISYTGRKHQFLSKKLATNKRPTESAPSPFLPPPRFGRPKEPKMLARRKKEKKKKQANYKTG